VESGEVTKEILFDNIDNAVAARLCRWGGRDPVIALRSITGYA
jgi:hypothetical protein